MASSISILALSAEDFSIKVFDFLKKGKRHAKILYQTFFTYGDFTKAYNPLEPQSSALIEQIKNLIRLPAVELKELKEHGETKKFLLKFLDGLVSETVCIPMKFGTTLCLSSQVGCKMGCAFCETGKMGLLRNLSTEEILIQVFYAKHILKQNVRNIVFMGMGEPFDNYGNVMKAIDILSDSKAFGIAKSHITVSTSGLVPLIYRFSDEADPAINLAISLNAPTDEVRRKIMPVNKEYPLSSLKEAMLYYTRNKRREILIEYVLLKGINDDLSSAQKLLDFLEEIPVKINLIPYNPQTKDRFLPPCDETCHQFLLFLRSKGAKALLRTTKGSEIMAACGQLGNLQLRKEYLQNAKLLQIAPY